MKKQLTFIVSAMLTSFEKVQIMKKIIFLIAIAFISLTTRAQNLLTNPSFETWSAGVPAGWTLTTTAGGTVSQSTKTINGLGSAFQIASPTGTYTIQQNVLPPAGATYFDTNITYKLSVNYLATAGDGTDARVWSGFITSAAGVTPIVYYAYPTNHADSLLYYIPIHGPGGNVIPPTGVVGNDANGYLLDNRSSGIWHTYTCNVKFPANITQFNFAVRTYSTSTVIWDNLFFGDAATDIQSPTVPTTLSNSTPTENSFTLSWNPSTDNVGIAGYDVYKDNVFYGSTTSTSLDITGLTPDKSYSMTVRAKDEAGNISNSSTALSVKTLAIYYDITVQIGLNGVVTENNVALSNGSIIKVVSGGTKTFTITPNTGYEINTITYGGVSVKSQIINNQFTTTNATSNSTLDVGFGLISAPGYKTINVTTAGTLNSLLTANEKTTITNLTLSGNIDARDFKTMRDSMPALTTLDVKDVSIMSYTGVKGTAGTSNINYPANTIPAFSFCDSTTWIGKEILSSIVLPLSIKSIGESAFNSCYGLKGALSIPNSVTLIDDYAFAYCDGFTGLLTIPNSVTEIGIDAFFYCTGFTGTLNIPSSVTSIGIEAFGYCTGLTELIIPNSITKISDYTFSYCKGLTTISFPNNLSAIGETAFFNCIGLQNVTIPSSVSSIGLRAFNWCFGLTQINVEAANQNFSSVDGVLFNKNKTALIQCPGGKIGDYVIPNLVDTIRTYAFYGCNYLTKLTIPTSVSIIGKSGLGYCNLLTNIQVANDNSSLSAIDGVLFNKNQTELIQCPAGKTGEYIIPNNVTAISESGFIRCNKLTRIIIPNSVTAIEPNTFYNCTALTSVNIPTTNTRIGEYAFSGCNALTTISIPATVSSLGNSTFSGCKGLVSLYAYTPIPIDLNNSTNTFYGINKNTCVLYVPMKSKALYQAANQWKDFTNIVEMNLLYVSTPGTLNSLLTATDKANISNLAIKGTLDARDFKTMRDSMPALSALDISSVNIEAYTGTEGPFSTSSTIYPINTIPDWAFHNADNTGKTSLTSVVLPNTISTIGFSSFDGCISLTNLVIPSSVTTLSDGAFWWCTSLNQINIPSSVTNIGVAVFSACSGLITVDPANPNYTSIDGVLFNKSKTTLIHCPTSISGSYIIPSTVTNIEQEAFNYCTKLTSVSMPSTVTTINNYAFNNCTGLNSLSLPTSLTTIGAQAFYNCINLNGDIIIPALVNTIGNSAFSFCTNINSVAIPASVTSIGIYAFYNCAGSINVDNSNPNYSSQEGILFNKLKTTLIQSPSSIRTSYIIPSTVTNIGPSAFSRCSMLRGITIPSSVTKISSNAFWGCSSLLTIRVPASVITIGSYAFSGCTGLGSFYSDANSPINLSLSTQVFYNVSNNGCKLYVPIGSKSLYQAANQWGDFTNIVEFTTAVPEVNIENIKLYPNPVIDNLIVSGFVGNASVAISDINGKTLITKQITGNGNIDINKLPKGLYFINIITNDGIFERKIIKQ